MPYIIQRELPNSPRREFVTAYKTEDEAKKDLWRRSKEVMPGKWENGRWVGGKLQKDGTEFYISFPGSGWVAYSLVPVNTDEQMQWVVDHFDF